MEEKFAKLIIEGKEYKLPIIEGSEGEKAVDISKLRAESSYIAFDPSFGNTGACFSKITYIDGEKGILRYRGFDIEDIVENLRFIEVAYLLLYDRLPNPKQLENFSGMLTEHSLMHEDMRHFFDRFPRGAYPMSILATMVNALSTFYPNVDAQSMKENVGRSAARLISIVRTLAAFAYKRSIGEPVVYPRNDLEYCANFMNMMFDSPVKPYEPDPEIIKILNMLLILHADHEQNCSTTAVRTIGSANVNLYSTISAGINALSGPLHGGANQAVMQMLKRIEKGGDIKKYLARAKDKKDGFRLMGFGHRVYKTYDPRAAVLKKSCHKLLKKLNINDPLLDIAMELEDATLKEDYFIERNLYPNVDFYSGIIYRAIGIPEDMFTVMFALGRLPGWISHWKEMVDGQHKIVRPRQIYTGKCHRELKLKK
jgi:citrate synthase